MPSPDLTPAVPGGVHGVLLLARIYHKSGDTDKAIKLYRQCHRLDQSMWVAFQARSQLTLVQGELEGGREGRKPGERGRNTNGVGFVP